MMSWLMFKKSTLKVYNIDNYLRPVVYHLISGAEAHQLIPIDSLEKMIDTTDESDQLYSIPGEFVNHLIITTGGNELYDIPSSQNYCLINTFQYRARFVFPLCLVFSSCIVLFGAKKLLFIIFVL